MAARAPLSLYRALLRAARTLPTENRRAFVRRKARDEFAAARDAAGERRDFLLRYAETSIDNVVAMAAHLREAALFRPDDAAAAPGLGTSAGDGRAVGATGARAAPRPALEPRTRRAAS